jgi:hypothetical protein
VTNLTGAVNHSQRALDMVIAEFHTTFTLIRHLCVPVRP